MNKDIIIIGISGKKQSGKSTLGDSIFNSIIQRSHYKSSYIYRKCELINADNNCPDYKPNRIKRFKDWLKGNNK